MIPGQSEDFSLRHVSGTHSQSFSG